MTNEEKLEAIRELVQEADKEVVRYYEEGFDPRNYSGGDFDLAWIDGMTDGTIEVCKEILAILNK